MADLPEEVVVEILSRLPVESLMRFKCVCKSWHALLKNQKFVARHHANQSKEHILIKRFCPRKESNVLSILSSGGDDDGGVVSVVDVDLPTHKEEKYLVIVGHCDGIVVLTDHNEEVIACNPAIREFRTLPKSSFHPYPQNYFGVVKRAPVHAYTNALGFGYDSQTKSHKVVRIVAFVEDMDGGADLPSKAEVFSLSRDDSCWREINNTVIGAHVKDSNRLEQYCNGVFYWWAVDDDTRKYVILSFDLADEVFRKAPVPDLWANWIYGNTEYLMVYNNGSIGFISHQYEGSDIEMWVMKEFGVKESWTKLATIGGSLQGLRRPLTFRNNDEEILHEADQGRLVAYNLVTLESKDLPIHGTPRCWRAATYMKTLVSVNGPREDIVS